jgi:hypothetical protein
MREEFMEKLLEQDISFLFVRRRHDGREKINGLAMIRPEFFEYRHGYRFSRAPAATEIDSITWPSDARFRKAIPCGLGQDAAGTATSFTRFSSNAAGDSWPSMRAAAMHTSRSSN